MLKSTIDVHFSLLTKIITHLSEMDVFQTYRKQQKLALPLRKMMTQTKKTIGLSVFLPHVSKIIERVMYIQIENFMQGKLSKVLTGFRKNHSTQHCLVNMLEKWKNTLDKGGFVCAIFIDLSKAFDTMNHDLLIARLGALVCVRK